MSSIGCKNCAYYWEPETGSMFYTNSPSIDIIHVCKAEVGAPNEKFNSKTGLWAYWWNWRDAAIINKHGDCPDFSLQLYQSKKLPFDFPYLLLSIFLFVTPFILAFLDIIPEAGILFCLSVILVPAFFLPGSPTYKPLYEPIRMNNQFEGDTSILCRK